MNSGKRRVGQLRFLMAWGRIEEERRSECFTMGAEGDTESHVEEESG